MAYGCWIKKRGSLLDNCPELCKEWDYEKNEFPPSQIMKGSTKKVWWKCKKCGHRWQATPNSRTGNKTGCPNCYKNSRRKK